eukprot:383289-Rhodomonas_salina.4
MTCHFGPRQQSKIQAKITASPLEQKLRSRIQQWGNMMALSTFLLKILPSSSLLGASANLGWVGSDSGSAEKFVTCTFSHECQALPPAFTTGQKTGDLQPGNPVTSHYQPLHAIPCHLIPCYWLIQAHGQNWQSQQGKMCSRSFVTT